MSACVVVQVQCLVAVQGASIIQHQRVDKQTVRLSDYGRFRGIAFNGGCVSESGPTIKNVRLSRMLDYQECWKSRMLDYQECWKSRMLDYQECWKSRMLDYQGCSL